MGIIRVPTLKRLVRNEVLIIKHLKSFWFLVIYLPANLSHLGNILRNFMPGTVLGSRDPEISETGFLFSRSPTV